MYAYVHDQHMYEFNFTAVRYLLWSDPDLGNVSTFVQSDANKPLSFLQVFPVNKRVLKLSEMHSLEAQLVTWLEYRAAMSAQCATLS